MHRNKNSVAAECIYRLLGMSEVPICRNVCMYDFCGALEERTMFQSVVKITY